MAYVSTKSTTQTSVTVDISGLSSPQNTYGNFRFRKDYGSWQYVSVDSSYTGYDSPNYTFSNLSCGTAYYIEAEVYTNAWYSVDAKWVNTDACPTTTTTTTVAPPSSLTGLSGSAVSKSQINLSWNSSSGASGYHIYKDNVYQKSVTSTSTSLTGLSEYTSYTCQVIPYNSTGSGTGQSVTVRTLDQTAPSCWNVQVTARSTEIDVTWDASDAHSGLSYFRVYRSSGGVEAYNTVSGGVSRSHTLTGLVKDTTYTIWVRAYDSAGNYVDSSSKTVITQSGRPDDWKWTTAQNTSGYKISGGAFRMGNDEWNNFTSRINDFLQYKLGTTTTFTQAYQGSQFTATMFNQAKNAIGGMAPTGIADKVKGDKVNASDFNTLMDKLNSL